jgi:SAM-dependent methyltransferase
MKFKLSELKKTLLEPSLTETKIAKILNQISKGFTSERSKITEYLSDRDQVSAYTVFYLPTNIPKLKFVFDQLPPSLVSDIQSSKILDLGTGPGTFAFAFDELFEGDVEVTGVDSSLLMLEQANRINDSLYKNEKITFLPTIPKDFTNETLFLGHSMNEMGVGKLVALVKSTKPRNLIIIEPGTSEVFTQVLKLREYMKNNGYSCVYPCASISSQCPVEKRREEGIEDWCHQVLRMTHDDDVERLSQLVKLDRKVMPLIAHVYTLDHSHKPSKARMVRFLRETKHSFDWEVCYLVEDNLEHCAFEVTKKGMSKKEIKALQKSSVGISFEYEVIKVLGEKHLRVKLL